MKKEESMDLNLKLHQSAIDNDIKSVMKWYSWGGDINWKNPANQQKTAVHSAVEKEYIGVTEYLVLNGGLVIEEDINNNTAEFYAQNNSLKEHIANVAKEQNKQKLSKQPSQILASPLRSIEMPKNSRTPNEVSIFALIIQSPDLEFKTSIKANSRVAKLHARLKVIFPGSTDNYGLFLEGKWLDDEKQLQDYAAELQKSEMKVRYQRKDESFVIPKLNTPVLVTELKPEDNHNSLSIFPETRTEESLEEARHNIPEKLETDAELPKTIQFVDSVKVQSPNLPIVSDIIPDLGNELEDQVQAISSYTSSDPRILSFNVGDIMTLTHQNENGWWDCIFNGKKGLVPKTLVMMIPRLVPSGTFPLPLPPRF